jgi:hypothetical protein
MTPAFREWIERARGEHLGAVLNSRQINLPGKGNKRAGPCPRCGGEDRFAVDLEREIFNCRGCGGKGHGAISLVMFLDGVNFVQAVETITREPPPKDAPQNERPRPRKARGKFVCAYTYTDETDSELFQVCRYAEPKSFSQRRPDLDHPGEWVAGLDDVRLVPYRLSDLVEGIANGHPVYWVEGEKDADNGALLGLITTTTAMGTAGKGHWERGVYDEFFRGANIILVPDQDADPTKGGELARVIGKRLKPIAASVHMLKLPLFKDLSEWIEHGGSRELLDEMPLDELPETNGHDHGEEWMMGEEPQAKPSKPVVVEPTTYILPDPATIPQRQWLLGFHYMRKVVTATVAPGGFGKTTLALFEAMSMVERGYRVWYISGEDDKTEIDRRIAAHCKQHIMQPIEDRLFVDDKMTFPFKIAKSSRNGPEFDDAKLEAFERAIIERKIDVVILDPFVSFHYLSENDTAAMDGLVKRLGEICVRCNCCIELSHHVRKPGIGQYEITVYDARGAAAIVNAVRSCRVINQMTAVEAQQAKIEKPASYIRIDSGKRNMAPPEKARWLHLVSIEIANGDKVQAIEPYEFRPEQATQEDDKWLKLTMTGGQIYRADSRSPEWLGHAVAKHFDRDVSKPGDVKWINGQIRIWMNPAPHRKSPLLRKVEREDKDRKTRLYFELVEEENVKSRDSRSADVIQFPSQAPVGNDEGRPDDLD